MLFVDNRTGCADLVMDPTNPNKLFAAMWEHRRKPWTFKSGGPGSGLYVTVDGGENWKELTDEDGLPKGDLGRIGVAVAKNNPNKVYALIESSNPMGQRVGILWSGRAHGKKRIQIRSSTLSLSCFSERTTPRSVLISSSNNIMPSA